MAFPAPARRPHLLLVAVAVLHAAAPIVLLNVHWWFGYDETVYLSQLNAHVPAGLFSAPRARGATLIAAPVTLLTSSVGAVRLWVTTLSGIGLYLAFRPWLRLRPGFTVPLAALLFCTIWSTTYYGFEVMPNEWVAFGVVAACGLLLRYLADGDRRPLVGVAVAMAVIGLLRPSDAGYAAVPLLGSCVLIRTGRRPRIVAGAAVLMGAVAGSAEWVIEAYVRFGGLARRVALAQAEQGGSGLHFAGAAQARALAGPLLCRTGCHPNAPLAFRLWWPALAVLVVVAVAYARRTGRLAPDLVPTAVGLAMAAQYVFTVTYAAPRFLLPAYAALSLPAAAGALHLVHAARGRRPRIALAAIATAMLLAHAAVQLDVLTRHIAPSTRHGIHVVFARARLLRSHDVEAPCLVLSDQNLAYLIRCANTPRTPEAVRDELSDGVRVCWIRTTRPSPTYGVQWTRVRLPGKSAPSMRIAYLSGAAQGPPRADDDRR